MAYKFLRTGLLSSSLLLGAYQVAMAQQEPTVPELKGEFTAVASCGEVLSKAIITPEHMRIAKERWKDRPDILNNDVLLRRWILEHFKLLGSVLDLPDLTAHPLAGRKIQLQLLSRDYLDQVGKSNEVFCVLPERGYFNPLNKKLANIRAELAESLNKFSPADFFVGKYLGIRKQYSDFLLQHEKGIKNPDYIKALHEIRSKMESAKDVKAVGVILDDIWAAMMALEEDHLTDATRKMLEAEKKFQELLKERFSDKDAIKDFNKDALEAMKEFLKEQIKKAEEAGDKALKKQLEEMMKQLEKMQQEMMKKPPNQDDAWKLQEMMKQMMRMQQTPMSSEMMQQMMEQMKQKMMDQETMRQLQEMIKTQQELLNNTEMTEAEKKKMLKSMRKALEGFTDQMKQRAKNSEQRLRDKIERRKQETGKAQERKDQEILKGLKEFSEELQRTIKKKQDGTTDPQAQKRLKDLDTKAQEISKSLPKKGDPIKPEDARKAFEDLQGIARELEKMDRFPLNARPKPDGMPQTQKKQKTSPPVIKPPKSPTPGKSLEEQARELQKRLQEAEEQRRKQEQGLKGLGKDADALKSLQKEIDSVKEKLKQPNLSEKDIREAMRKLEDIQKKITEREELNMEALQKNILALIAQLGDRVDEVGAKEYIKESAARRSSKSDVAKQHDSNQRLVMSFGYEMDDIAEDIRERLNKKHPMTEEEGRATIKRLGEIKAELDRLDPPDPKRKQGRKGQGKPGRSNSALQKNLMSSWKC